jgi:membrane-associated protein
MNTLNTVFSVVLHLDQHLRAFALDHPYLVYGVLFGTIFIETGLVLLPFLPGDSLLFMAGALSGMDVLEPRLTAAGLVMAAVVGNQTNFMVGRFLGSYVQKLAWFNRRAFEKAQVFFRLRGGMTLIVARFVPFLRTFAPFVAGVAGPSAMPYRRFVRFDVGSSLLWVGSLFGLGYGVGNTPYVQAHLQALMLVFVLVPTALFVVSVYLSRSPQKTQTSSAPV